ncbi:helix-turn-helix domain-containing protein [Simiduia curdlanivorans]|uniref:Helix-turn-helix domain-containing protein n=1 Tax=Simiduia curdlanivorans TaxID=1492769 RepID=A0ABV8V2U1_9GAMM|nr:helix-turn-helix domain-containing protein [Simiduia curdlanivorans]MDN3637879.1 helix-turn-helix domain-containing protein [Simiduia curdlanivorans]
MALEASPLLFNTNDLTLVVAVVQYLVLAILVVSATGEQRRASWLLAGILTINAAIALDTLLVWSDTLRHLMLQQWPSGLLIGSLGYWLQGPLLHFYTRALLFRESKFTWLDSGHLLPLCFAAIGLMLGYSLRSSEVQWRLMSGTEFLYGEWMKWNIYLRNASILIYGAWCFRTILNYRRRVKDRFSDASDRQHHWLWWFVGGFMALAAWALLIHAIGAYVDLALSDRLGIFTNYLNFLFVNSLVILSLRYARLINSVSDANLAGEAESINPEHIGRIERYMASNKPYLQHDLNLEQLAHGLSLPERSLSQALNRHFGKNFFEFINGYRLEAAKAMLASAEHQQMSILELLSESGFSSKSTFNAFFKQATGMTPTAYRKVNG